MAECDWSTVQQLPAGVSHVGVKAHPYRQLIDYQNNH